MRYPMARVNRSYRATNPVFGTGLAQTNLAAWAAVSPLMVIFNSDAAGGDSLFIDFIKLINTAPGTASTSAQLGMILDIIDRWTSGGTRLTTGGPFNVNTDRVTAPKARIDFGAIVAPAANTPRQVSRDSIKTQAAPCWVAGDEVYIKFDGMDVPPAPTSGATTAMYPAPTGPVVIAPGHSFLLYLWGPAMATPPSWEVEVGWWEGKAA